MTILVNYYPCSYGDSLVYMFRNDLVERKSGTIHEWDYNELKHLAFYNLALAEKIEFFKNFSGINFISCHRQQGFDFRQLDPDIKVISITQLIPDRVVDTHLVKRQMDLGNPLLNKLKSKLSQTEWKQLVEKDYNIWAKNNILESDTILEFSTMLDHDAMRSWCTAHNLPFNSAHFYDWFENIKQYQIDGM